jgi:hypothetical protein
MFIIFIIIMNQMFLLILRRSHNDPHDWIASKIKKFSRRRWKNSPYLLFRESKRTNEIIMKKQKFLKKEESQKIIIEFIFISMQ